MDIHSIQAQNFRARDYRWGNLEAGGRQFAHLLPKLTPMLKFGVTSEYYGLLPSADHSPNYHHNRTNSIEILNKFRKLEVGRKVFINSSSLDDGGVETAQTALVNKRNPDRALSAGNRLISDLRRVDIQFDSEDCYPAVCPSVSQLAEEILRLRRLRPGIPAIMCKRDVDGAVTLLYFRPDVGSVLATDFPAEDLGFETDIAISHLRFSFGWLASPSFYQIFDESAPLHHANLGPPNPAWNGYDAFRQFTSVGNSMFIESQIGNRPALNVTCWESRLKRRAGNSSINEDKLRLGGKWCTSAILLGFEFNTLLNSVAIPKPKILGPVYSRSVTN